MSKKVIIGSRGSDLALWQAHFFQDSLTAIGVESEIKIITTKGDRIQHLSFDKIEGKGFFTKEIEAALLASEIDVAIHSHKDLETQMPDGLCIAGVSHRANPSDVLLIHPKAKDATQLLGFKADAVVGTSSARRKSQIKALRGDITIKDIRGNVPTRIEKLRSGDFDAILLAAAGLDRLELDVSDLGVNVLDPRVFVPAPAQGVLAYQCRENDAEMQHIVRQLHNQPVANAIDIERSILSGFGGGCHIPIGVHAEPMDEGFNVRASFGKDWDKVPTRVRFMAKDRSDALAKFELLKNQDLPKSVIITRNLDKNGHFSRACLEHGIEVMDTPFIHVNHLNFNFPSDFDWVFFASSNGVEAFFAKYSAEDVKSKKLAVYGQATARALSEFVDTIDFIPEPGQPSEVAAQLIQKVGSKKILFPTSSITLGTIAEHFPSDQVEHVCAYETIEADNDQLDGVCDAHVFTSPSNVRGFLNSGNIIKDGAKVIAIGNSTKTELVQNKIDSLVADIPHEAELFALLCS